MLDLTAGYLMTLLIALAAVIVFAVAWYVWGRYLPRSGGTPRRQANQEAGIKRTAMLTGAGRRALES